MAVYQDLLDAIARLRADTGDPAAWMRKLSADEVAMVASPITVNSPGLIDAVLAKIDVPRGGGSEPAAPGGGGEPAAPGAGGDAARAINIAEAALAQQNSATAQLDLQVVSAILNAHATNAAGLGELDDLQREVESAVVGRANLDTPAGARELQRHLTGLIREITTVVQSSSLDATSKAALAAALASLYQRTTAVEGRQNPDDAPPAASTTGAGDAEPPSGPAADPVGADRLFDELFAPDPGEPVLDAPQAPPAVPMSVPQIPAVPGFGGLGSSPAPGLPTGGIGLPAGGLPMPGPMLDPATLGASLAEPGEPPARSDMPDDSQPDGPQPDGPQPDDSQADDTQKGADKADAHAGDEGTEQVPAGQTVVLPTGEVITARSPELARAISAAMTGTPIAEAFQRQGITLPAPGSDVPNPLDPEVLQPGDVGVFADRHALALGNGKAVLNNQIQPIANIAGPGFLGWLHPPVPGAVTPTDDQDAPAPTRPAVTAAPSG